MVTETAAQQLAILVCPCFTDKELGELCGWCNAHAADLDSMYTHGDWCVCHGTGLKYPQLSEKFYQGNADTLLEAVCAALLAAEGV